MKMIDLKALKSRARKILREKGAILKPKTNDLKQLLEELSLYQIELEIQNEDLIKTQSILEDTLNNYITLYELAPLGYFTLNEKGLIIEVNQAAEILLGLDRASLINRCLSRYIHIESQALFSQHLRYVFQETTQHHCELKLLRWQGTPFYTSVISKAVVNKENGQKKVLIFVKDISHEKAQEDLINKQRVKLASIDKISALIELASNISFEQRNSLTIIDNYINGCIRRIENKNIIPDELLKCLKKASEQSKQLLDLTYKIKNSTTKKVYQYEKTTVHSVIKDTIAIIKYETYDYPVNIYFDPSDCYTVVKLDKIHIQQVILSLARNAIDAMKDAKVSQPQIIIETKLIENNMIQITILDNGPGFHPSLASKLFDAHFTTKSYSVGLGLTQSRSIVEKHGGQLKIDLNPGGGTCSKVSLPCLLSS